MKELYMAAHEELVCEYLEENQGASEEEAYEKTADAALDRMTEKFADMVDSVTDRMRELNRGLDARL